MDPLARAAFWAREAQIDPADAEAGVRLSSALRALGRYREAAQAADVVLVSAPANLEALLESARAKIGGGQAFYAIELLKRAQAAAPKDWRPLSLLGVALEQTQRPDEARQAFDQALALSPDNPAVLSNLALFHAAHGDAAQAETLLRRAVSRPGAEAQERQNLALVLGLQGKLAEAERLMRQDLPPEVANANLAYLRASAGQLPPGVQAGRSWGAVEDAQAARSAQR
jgi:Flp pilus assembly protein TadD